MDGEKFKNRFLKSAIGHRKSAKTCRSNTAHAHLCNIHVNGNAVHFYLIRSIFLKNIVEFVVPTIENYDCPNSAKEIHPKDPVNIESRIHHSYLNIEALSLN